MSGTTKEMNETTNNLTLCNDSIGIKTNLFFQIEVLKNEIAKIKCQKARVR